MLQSITFTRSKSKPSIRTYIQSQHYQINMAFPSAEAFLCRLLAHMARIFDRVLKEWSAQTMFETINTGPSILQVLWLKAVAYMGKQLWDSYGLLQLLGLFSRLVRFIRPVPAGSVCNLFWALISIVQTPRGHNFAKL